MWKVVLFTAAIVTGSLCVDQAKVLQTAKAELPHNVLLDRFEGPNIDATTCNGLWSQHGFICNKQKLLELSKSDEAAIKATVNQFNAVVPKFRELILTLREIYPSNSTLHVFYDASRNFLPQSTEKCWAKMSQIRSSSLCSMCSGNNYEYFLNNKAAITEMACQLIFVECKDHIDFINFMATIEKRVYHFLIEELEKHQAAKQSLEKLDNGFLMKQKKIQNSIESLSKLIVEYISCIDVDARIQIANKVCQAIVRLRETPMLINLNEKLSETVDAMNLIATHLKPNVPRSLFNKIRPTTNWRALQSNFGNSLALTSSLVTGDVVVVKGTDNMFATFGNANQDPVKPMNLSLAFP